MDINCWKSVHQEKSLTMKNKEKPVEKTMVQQLRDIRDEVNAETLDMNFEEFKKYVNDCLNSNSAIFPNQEWK